MKDKLFNKFLYYETKHKLFDIEFKNIKIWEILRTYVYIEIEQIYNNLQPLFPQKKINKYKAKGYKTIAIISKTDLLSDSINKELAKKGLFILNVGLNDDLSDDKFKICTI